MTQPKRVLHFQGRMGLGGAESFMMNLYRGIDRNSFQFDFLIYDDFEDVQDYHKEIEKLGGRIFVVKNPKKNIAKYLLQVNHLLKTEKFDIAHNEVYFGGGINLWLAKKNKIKKRIAHSHATEDGKGNGFIKKIVRKFFHWLLMHTATDFVAVSTEAGKSLFGNHPFQLVHNGIDLNLYRVSRERILKKRVELGIPEDAFVVGNIGRLEDQKNQTFLISIFNELRKTQENAQLLIIGEGSKRLVLEKRIREFGVRESVKLLGERNDIPELLGIMDVFVMTSLYEGLPMVGLEAQASRKKVVLSDTISPDTALTPLVSFISLNEPESTWVDAILKKPYVNEITDELEKYDVTYTVKQMTAIYDN